MLMREDLESVIGPSRTLLWWAEHDPRTFEALRATCAEDQIVLDLVSIPQREAAARKSHGLCW